MKKFAVLSIVLILVASMVMPAMAGNGNGHGNGNGGGQGNSAQNQDKVKTQNQDKHENKGLGKFKNTTNNNWMKTPFYVQGVVTAVSGDSITITVIHANAKAKTFIGTDMVIKVNEATQIFQITQGEEISGTEPISDTARTETPKIGSSEDENEKEGDEDSGRVPITLGQITAGQRVAVHGRFFTPDYVARLITVYIGGKVGGPLDSKSTTP